MYATRDGKWVSMVASSNPIFRRLCMAIDRPDLADDPRFGTNPARVTNLAALDAVIAAWFGARSYGEVAAALEEQEIPFSKIFSIEDIVRDPHFQARAAIVRLPDPELGSVPAPCAVPRFSGHTPAVPRTGPAVGEHNEEVYGGLGLTPSALAALRGQGVI
ncbi:Acyl-CoA transferase (fragment) [Cupriavidus taiwanensis]|uniref:Acyl-CoA transferase n=1 Tax=Cupriavidus taiwanensis TaxID=164546 RepID=A0A375C6V7_9BURK